MPKIGRKNNVCIVTCSNSGIEPSIGPIQMLANILGGKFDSLAFTGGHSNNSIANDEKKMTEALDFGKKIAGQL